jgi:hypothetical protein
LDRGLLDPAAVGTGAFYPWCLVLGDLVDGGKRIQEMGIDNDNMYMHQGTRRLTSGFTIWISCVRDCRSDRGLRLAYWRDGKTKTPSRLVRRALVLCLLDDLEKKLHRPWLLEIQIVLLPFCLQRLVPLTCISLHARDTPIDPCDEICLSHRLPKPANQTAGLSLDRTPRGQQCREPTAAWP